MHKTLDKNPDEKEEEIIIMEENIQDTKPKVHQCHAQDHKDGLESKKENEGERIGENMYVFQFNHPKDKQYVLDNQPWHFNRDILVLKEVPENKQSSMIDLLETLFWIRAYDLLLRKKVPTVRGRNLVTKLPCQ